MPGKLAYYLPFVPEADRQELYGSLWAVATYPRGNPIREGVILGMHHISTGTRIGNL